MGLGITIVGVAQSDQPFRLDVVCALSVVLFFVSIGAGVLDRAHLGNQMTFLRRLRSLYPIQQLLIETNILNADRVYDDMSPRLGAPFGLLFKLLRLSPVT